MKKIEAVIKTSKLNEVKQALEKEKIQGMTISEAKGFSGQSHVEVYRGAKYDVVDLTPQVKIEVFAKDDEVEQLVNTIVTALRAGHACDSELFILPAERVVCPGVGERS